MISTMTLISRPLHVTSSIPHIHMPPLKALPTTAPPPPKPAYILRGHLTPIHALTFLSNNQYLLTADASGICILWLLSTRRPLAVWSAHTNSILSVAEWVPRGPASSDRRIITHGRDNRIRVWKLPRAEDNVATALPVDEGAVVGKAPWMVASLEVNALNFCGFGFCQEQETTDDDAEYRDALIAVPSALDSQAIDIFTLPSTRRVYTRISPPEKTGMAMALALRFIDEETLTLIAGYESGHVVVFRLVQEKWEVSYSAQPHSQPILSLSLFALQTGYFLTTSADSLIIQHPLGLGEVQKLDTRHAGLQSVCIRSDGKIFATAGWDGRFRIFSTKGKMKELAVLKWHTVGCYAVTFADILDEKEGEGEKGEKSVELARVRRESRRHWVAGGAKDGKVSLWEVF